MKLATNHRLETNMQAQARAFQIKAGSKAFQILSSNIYKHKELAIVRELLCNAIDAHVAAGTQDTPIKLTLPAALNPQLIIEDFGTGLSEQEIYDLYTTYFGSNKTHTNDLIGGLGLGSKSPFAYTDQFTVESRHNGRRTTYQVFVSSDGVPQVSKVSDREDPATPAGLTVRIPVAECDRDKFESAALQFLKYALPVSPVQVQLRGTDSQIEPVRLSETFTVDVDGTPVTFGWADHHNNPWSSPSVVAMQGVVPYELDLSVVPDLPRVVRTMIRHASFNHQMMFLLPVGTLDIAPSREALSYDQGSIRKIERIVKTVADYYTTNLISLIKNSDTLLLAAHAVNRNAGFLSDEDSVSWKGRRLFPGFNAPSEAAQVGVYQVTRKHATIAREKLSTDPRQLARELTQANISLSTPDELYWAPPGHPFKRFFSGSLRYRAVMLVSKKRADAERLAEVYGWDPNAIEDVPLVKRTKRSNSARRSSGSSAPAEYTAAVYISNAVYNTRTNKYTAGEFLDRTGVIKAVAPPGRLHDILAALDKYVGKTPHLVPGQRIEILLVPESHKRVTQELQNTPGFCTTAEEIIGQFKHDEEHLAWLTALVERRKEILELIVLPSKVHNWYTIADRLEPFDDNPKALWLWWLAARIDYLQGTVDPSVQCEKIEAAAEQYKPPMARARREARRFISRVKRDLDRLTKALGGNDHLIAALDVIAATNRIYLHLQPYKRRELLINLVLDKAKFIPKEI